MDKPERGCFRAEVGRNPHGGRKVTRADLAEFLLDKLEPDLIRRVWRQRVSRRVLVKLEPTWASNSEATAYKLAGTGRTLRLSPVRLSSPLSVVARQYVGDRYSQSS